MAVTFSIRLILPLILCPAPLPGQTLSREQWGAPGVTVTHAEGKWTIAGKKNTVTLNETNLALTVQAGSAKWAMAPSGTKDMLVQNAGTELYLRLADAKEIQVVPYDTGFKTGVKIKLARWSEIDAKQPLEGMRSWFRYGSL
jgi:hypothetical protein